MMATSNSVSGVGRGVSPLRAWGWAVLFLLGSAAAGFVSPGAAEKETPAPPTTSSTNVTETTGQRFERLYSETRRRWQRETNSDEAAWHFARACFDWADIATNDARRAAIAEEGIAASRRAIQLAPKSAAGHYYLGLNLGQLAQTKLWGALKLIDQMESAWFAAVELDPKFDYAGPHRALTLLYRDAPGWPTSVGSRSKARRHLQKAIELSPDYPGNRICWLESLLEWGEVTAVRTHLESVERMLQDARTKFTGEMWARDWEDWDRKWRKIQSRVGKGPKPKR